MSVEQIEASLLKLPSAQRAAFADWFYEHEDELLGSDDNEIHPEVQAEILRRRAEARAHPELLEPWEGTTERLREQLNEIRRQKAQAR
jgi:hypothetical protein